MSLTQLGRYELIRLLGKGAMGLVYEARDPNLDRRVAIKTIRVDNLSAAESADYEQRFRTEARSAARLQHPNIVSVYDSGHDRDVAFLVMEFVYGDDLKHHLDHGRRYTLAQTLRFMADLLSALDYAHRQNIVHRDIKPANLLIEASGRVKLTDFGVARMQDAPDATRTQGAMVGTLKYMSPEQVKGLKVDNRADIFSAGIVLHQLLTGKRAFDGESDFAVMQQIICNQPAAPSFFNPQLPVELDAVLAKALAKARDERFATAQEFAEALQRAGAAASDIAVQPAGEPSAGPSGSTWSATVRVGESLLNTVPGRRADTQTTPLAAGTPPGGATVTQELELVYWKDVKDSADKQDIDLFLEKFPAGVYADLARRRQKKLSCLSGDETDTGLRILLRGNVSLGESAWTPPVAPFQPPPGAVPTALPLAVSSLAAESVHPLKPAPATLAATTLLPNHPSAEAVPVEAATPVPTAASSTNASLREPTNHAATTSPRSFSGAVWIPTGVAALLITGAGITFWPTSGAPVALSAPTTTTPAAPPADAASLQTALAAVSALPPAPIVGTPTPTQAPPGNLKTGMGMTAPVAPASRASTPSEPGVKTAARTTAVKLATAGNAAAPAAKTKGLASAEVVNGPNALNKPVAASAAATPQKPANPRQACEDRLLLAFQVCMTEQCAKPALAQHPVCVERHLFDQRRREADQLRR